MPMRTPFTPALPTWMWLCPDTITVPGSSTTRRDGESAVVSLGVTAPRALISTRISSVPRTTSTRCSSLRWLAGCDAGVWAAETARTSNGRNTLSNCFRISLLPNPRAWPACPSVNSILSARRSPVRLNCRRKDPFHHFPRQRFAQLVLHGLLEYNRVSCDFQHVAVEHGIVFVQEISLVQAVGHHCDEAAFRLHHSPQIDLPDVQAFLSRGASGTACLLHNRTEEGVALAVHRPLLRLWFRFWLWRLQCLGSLGCFRRFAHDRKLFIRRNLGNMNRRLR